jgi:hypothetical protein
LEQFIQGQPNKDIPHKPPFIMIGRLRRVPYVVSNRKQESGADQEIKSGKVRGNVSLSFQVKHACHIKFKGVRTGQGRRSVIIDIILNGNNNDIHCHYQSE